MDGDRTKILIADDNSAIADVLRFNLERAGFQVTVASNGRHAAEHASRERFDMVLTDCQMPEVSGEELCRLLRQDPRHAEVPIFLISAKGFELDVEGLTEEFSLSGILHKPFSPRAIVGLVRAALEPAVV